MRSQCSLSYIVSDGVVTEIQRHDDRRSAVAALG